jgi:hypothetical protein
MAFKSYRHVPMSSSAEARGLVRLINPEGTLTTWVEAVKVPARLEAGWTRA